jgi:hypothetical protein
MAGRGAFGAATGAERSSLTRADPPDYPLALGQVTLRHHVNSSS